MFQACIELDIYREFDMYWFCCAYFSDTSKMVNEIIIAFS